MDPVRHFAVISLMLVVVLHHTGASPTIPCGENVDKKFIPDSLDCSTYYICSRGVITQYNCGEDKAFYGHACFEKFSKYDICNRYRSAPFRSRQLAVNPEFRTTCQPGEVGLFPHPFKCALYYNCSDYSENLRKPYLNECQSPLLFDNITRSCREESEVDCGTRRIKPANQCDYLRNQCLTSHGMPCGVLMPSCEGLPNGYNVWEDRPDSPHYIECLNGDLMHKKICGFTNIGGTEQRSFFDQERRSCGRPS